MGSHSATGAIWIQTWELPCGSTTHSMSSYIFPAKSWQWEKKCIGGGGHIMAREGEKCMWHSWEERDMKCVGPSQIPNIVFSFAEKGLTVFSWERSSTSSFLKLTDHGFALTLFPLFFSDYILFCVLRKVWWDFPLPQVNKLCSWANRTPTQHHSRYEIGKKRRMKEKLETE